MNMKGSMNEVLEGGCVCDSNLVVVNKLVKTTPLETLEF